MTLSKRMPRPSVPDEVESLIEASRSDFEVRDWWDSPKREDIANRRHVETMWDQIREHYESLSDGLASVECVLMKLETIGETDRVVVGYSVGYKKPGPGELRWANVKSADNPLDASRMAAGREDVQRWLDAGFHEYGISPMIERRPKAPDQAAKSPAPKM